jgi:hypothetical protein
MITQAEKGSSKPKPTSGREEQRQLSLSPCREHKHYQAAVEANTTEILTKNQESASEENLSRPTDS